MNPYFAKEKLVYKLRSQIESSRKKLMDLTEILSSKNRELYEIKMLCNHTYSGGNSSIIFTPGISEVDEEYRCAVCNTYGPKRSFKENPKN